MFSFSEDGSDESDEESTFIDNNKGEYSNTFYEGITANNIDFLRLYIGKWMRSDCGTEDFDSTLSRPYEELCIKNVPITEETEIFIKQHLLKLRFLSHSHEHYESEYYDIHRINERVVFVSTNIKMLKARYWNAERIDDTFLFVIKFIAKNMHMLKQQLKSTYDKLPWEELEFYLVSYISLITKHSEIDIFNNFALNNKEILNYLNIFANKLRLEIYAIVSDENNRNKLSDLPNISRKEVIANVTRKYPQFGQLYEDHRFIRDIHSLMKIRDYAKSALTADTAGRVGQLAVLRALQVIGEYLKNDLENPKLDTTQSELILLLFSKDIRKFILDLRNSSSDVHSFCKRIEIEENADDNFFTAVRYNLAAIIDVISYILYRRKIRILRILIKHIIDSDSIEVTKRIFERFIGYEFEDMDIMKSSKMRECEKTDKLLRDLSDKITEKTQSEKEKFKILTAIINASKTTSKNDGVNHGRAVNALRNIRDLLNYNDMDDNSLLESTKGLASNVLGDTLSSMRSDYFTKIVELIKDIFHSALPRIQTKNLDEVKRLSIEILYNVYVEGYDPKSIKEIMDRIIESTYEPYKGFDLTNKDYDDLLTLKSSELYNLLSRNGLIGNKTILNFPFCKDDKALQAAIEILVLDIMSILDTHKNQLTNNILFLDDDAPLLTGKCLHKYLAHGDSLIDLFLPNPSIEIILNAERLMSTNVTKCHTKIGKLIHNSPYKIIRKCRQFFKIILAQIKLFSELEKGNREYLNYCLIHGADIQARTRHKSTTLHSAAKGPCIDSLKLVLKQFENANMKDVYGRSPLHVAVAEKRTNIVDYLVRNTYVYIEDQDNMKRTPLHIAALINHIDIVKILLTYNANTASRDRNGYSPLHYAIKYNRIDVAKIILEKEVNVDVNDTLHHDTPLHIAAENGHLELVNYLLKKKANVNARNDEAKSPLHLAVTNGHEDVVNVLLLTEAEVNAKCNKGYTPLHYAIESRDYDLIDIILNHGADINAADNSTNETPLHFAVEFEDEDSIMALLENNADTSIVSVEGFTPLHVAAQSYDVDIVDTLLKHGSDISCTNVGTPLFSAVQSSDIEVTKLLMNNGANVNVKNRDGTTPLHVAIMNGFNDIAEHLIKNNADIHARDDCGHTPLHIAAMKNNVSIIDLLIKYKDKVNGITEFGLTPLYLSALHGNEEAAALLIKHRADVNIQSAGNTTPLHGACLNGNENIVNLLLLNKADVNGANAMGFTPLLIAIEAGHKKVVEILIANGAYVIVNARDKIPLLYAINHNRKEIVEVLIDNGADIYLKCGEPLLCAVRAGYSDILQVLLSNGTSIDIESLAAGALLHLATDRGHKDVVNILVSRGYNVNAKNTNGATPLCIAAKQGHGDIAEILIANGANVDVQSDEDTPLHIAVKYNNTNVVKVLLNNKADINIKGHKNEKRSPLELAVETGNLPIVKMILKNRMVDVNGTGANKWAVLHMAANNKNINMLKYLVNYGYDVNIRDEYGLKPIHIAIMAGYIDNVHFLLGKEAYNNEHSIDRQVLLRCAVVSGHTEVVRYLVDEGAEVNGNNIDILTPMHVAAICGCKDVVKVLLNKDAIFNLVDKDHKTPLQMSTCPDVTNVLSLIAKLFKSIRDNNFLEVEKNIRAGAIVNAKNCNNLCPLHYAVWKGNNHIVDILLQNGAKPNVLDISGFTPLHYAAQFSHLDIVQTLLLHGAVYDAVSRNGKNPEHLTKNEKILAVFKLISASFKHVSEKNTKFFIELNETRAINIMKLIISARSSIYKTLVIHAAHHNFPLMELLRLESQSELDDFKKAISIVDNKGDYNKALSIFINAFERRKKMLGLCNTGTLTVQRHIARLKLLQKKYQEAIDILEHIYQKQNETLGLNSRYAMVTRARIAFILHERGLHKAASDIYREVYQQQCDTLGPSHVDTVQTQFHLAAVLLSLRKYEEASKMYKSVIFARKSYLKENDADNLEACVQLAMSLFLQKKYAEALDLYKKVFEIKNTIFGIQNVETLQALWKVAQTLVILNKYDEALGNFQKILDTTKEMFQEPHPLICRTQYELANILYCQGKYISALSYYSVNVEIWKRALKFSDSSAMTNSLRKIELIKRRLMSDGREE